MRKKKETQFYQIFTKHFRVARRQHTSLWIFDSIFLYMTNVTSCIVNIFSTPMWFSWIFFNQKKKKQFFFVLRFERTRRMKKLIARWLKKWRSKMHIDLHLNIKFNFEFIDRSYLHVCWIFKRRGKVKKLLKSTQKLKILKVF